MVREAAAVGGDVGPGATGQGLDAAADDVTDDLAAGVDDLRAAAADRGASVGAEDDDRLRPAAHHQARARQATREHELLAAAAHRIADGRAAVLDALNAAAE